MMVYRYFSNLLNYFDLKIKFKIAKITMAPSAPVKIAPTIPVPKLTSILPKSQ